MNADDKARRALAYQIRLLALALSRLAGEIERPVRERPFRAVDTGGIIVIDEDDKKE